MDQHRYEHLDRFADKMAADGIDTLVIDTFGAYYRQVVDGATGIIPDDAIRPPREDEVISWQKLDTYAEIGKGTRAHAVRITLNGGLGTSMGLTGPKSLLPVKDHKSFLDIIVGQASCAGIRQVLMNSFSTQADTEAALQATAPSETPMMFLQNRFPKILQDSLAPASWPANPRLEWNPPGHGDIYTAMVASGILDKLLDEDIQYALICNSDNLGAIMDDRILGYFAHHELPFLMEVAQRLPADAKGGHLAVNPEGRMLLRESAQFPEESAGRDINTYRLFNTNNLWVNLTALKALITREKTLLLPLILNAKTLDPRDTDSPPVYQVESAMGAAITLFNGARAVEVPRTRFFPVKTCNQLLTVRSDAFRLKADLVLEPNPAMTNPGPHIDLDPRFYSRIDMFDARFPQGIPSLVRCQQLRVAGDILFEGGVQIIGHVTITNPKEDQAIIKANTIIEQNLQL